MHYHSENGVEEIRIYGTIERLNFDMVLESSKVAFIDVLNWGPTTLGLLLIGLLVLLYRWLIFIT